MPDWGSDAGIQTECCQPGKAGSQGGEPPPQTGDKSLASQATPPQGATQPKGDMSRRMTSKEMKSDIDEFDKKTDDPDAKKVFMWLAK